MLSTLADLNARVEGGEAISKLSCYYSRDTGLAVAIGLEYCTAQDVAAMQVKLDQLCGVAFDLVRRATGCACEQCDTDIIIYHPSSFENSPAGKSCPRQENLL